MRALRPVPHTRPVRDYLGAAAALGVIAVWGSENLFWSTPPDGFVVGELVITWLAYSVCAAAALSAVLVTGVQGWRAAFLGGAVLGWLVEGVVVGTMYDAFPLQLVWTPLAWHALVTGVVVVGLGRAAGRMQPHRRLLAWVALGLGGGIWAAYWPLERDAMPGPAATAAYLVGFGLAVPVANLALDRIGTVALPGRRVLLVAPALLLLAWVARVVLAPSPVLLALPAVLALTWWVMRRHGAGGRGGLWLGPPAPLAVHAQFLTAPVVASAVAAAVWWAAPDGLYVNIAAAVASAAVSCWLYGRLLLRARSLQR